MDCVCGHEHMEHDADGSCVFCDCLSYSACNIRPYPDPEPEAFRDAMLQSGAQAEGTLMSEIRGEWYSAEEILAYMVSIGVKIPAIEKDMLSAGIKPKEQETVTMAELIGIHRGSWHRANDPIGEKSALYCDFEGIRAVLRAAEGKKVIDV